ncbi:MAG: hypothetical protein ACKOZZ_14655, partial [Bacteroidota bacterium]
VIVDKKYFQRTISIKNPNPSHLLRIAMGNDIVKKEENRYVIDGKSYYIEITGATIEESADMKVLVVPAAEKVQYSIIW